MTRIDPVRTTRAAVVVVSVSVLIVFAAGCHDSNDLVGTSATPTRAPSPTPGASVIAGAWSGTLVPDDFADCETVAIQATFDQNGSSVSGVLETSIMGCVPSHIELQGTLTGGQLTGTVSGSGRYVFHDDPATGAVTGGTLVIEMHDGPFLIPGGVATFHR